MIKSAFKSVAVWVCVGFILGAFVGLVSAVAGTGHVGVLSCMLLFVTAGSLLGIIGGFVFTLTYLWAICAHRKNSTGLPGTSLRALIGALAGFSSAFATDWIFGLAAWPIVGIVFGLFTGLLSAKMFSQRS